VISDVSPDLVKRFASRADLAAQDVFPYCQQVFVTHATNGLTANPLIRKAIGAVVNVDDIIAASGSVVARRNHSLVYPESPYYPGDATAKYYDRKNVAEARELLKQAGYKGEKLVLQTNSNYAYMRDSIVVLDEMLKEAGFNTEVQITDWLTNSTNLQRGTGNWNVSTTGFCSQPLLGPQQWKTMVYVFPHLGPEPAMDAAYQRFFTSLDPAARKAAWLDIETRMLDQAYFIKVRDMGSIRGYNKKVEGMTPYYFLRFWNVSVK
jgi:peptide/nickel transport system substrate-binding protein